MVLNQDMTRNEIKKEITRIKDVLIEFYKPDRIILFGSAASGNFTSDSDLDFLVIKKDVPYRGIDRTYEVDKLIERRGTAIDILVFKPEEIKEALESGDPFISEIMKNGDEVYGGQKTNRRMA